MEQVSHSKSSNPTTARSSAILMPACRAPRSTPIIIRLFPTTTADGGRGNASNFVQRLPRDIIGRLTRNEVLAMESPPVAEQAAAITRDTLGSRRQSGLSADPNLLNAMDDGTEVGD